MKKGSGISRRHFIGTVSAGATMVTTGGATLVATQTSEAQAAAPDSSAVNSGTSKLNPGFADGPVSSKFQPLPFQGNNSFTDLESSGLSANARENAKEAPKGACVCWGIPFRIDRVALLQGKPVELRWPETQCPWIVCLHTADMAWPKRDAQGFIQASHGQGLLNDHLADYVFLYADGHEERVSIRRRHQIGMLQRNWGENCFQAVAHQKPSPIRTSTEQPRDASWGWAQTRVSQPDMKAWVNWLWAWENPRPEKPLVGLRLEPKQGAVILSAVTAGKVAAHPLRWERRQKAIFRLPEGQPWDPNLDGNGCLKAIQLDLGQVISAQPRGVYPNDQWPDTYNNQPPKRADREFILEFAAHPEAEFQLADGRKVSVRSVMTGANAAQFTPLPSANHRVKLLVVDESGKPVAVKLHVHGSGSEYLPPVDRHRLINPYWYEDWSVDYLNAGTHFCTYIPGETSLDLPLGPVFIEISKGFEIAPIRQRVVVAENTQDLKFTVKRMLPWRQRGWVTADTHVHFLSPTSALLEGAGEGINLVNLLASQWGELMTNVGDFDGQTTHGSREPGSNGEYLVRVGTENRQHVLGHISLLAYRGPIIAPMTSGGPDESALGDPVEVLLTEWARQCHQQKGVVVLPHFPNPRCENAAAIVSGEVDAVEMTSWGNLYGGIDPYSLSDWYRYLNCGHFVAAVGGTDKMEAGTAVGAVRTYARLRKGREFNLETWKDAIRAGNTFVTYGPLLEFSVAGKPPGARFKLSATGGTVDVEWQVASVTVPMSRVELVVNGEIRETQTISPREDRGHWSVKINRSSWVALRVRGHYTDRPEIIAAHSSPVMIEVAGSAFFSAADALTILDQIEGAMAYLDTIGTRAETKAYQRMRMVLTSAHRSLHNRLHQQGVFHDHTVGTDHSEHHKS